MGRFVLFPKLSLKAWFHLLALLLLAVAITVTGRMSYLEWTNLQRVDQSKAALHLLRLTLKTTEMASRERGPTNSALGQPPYPGHATPPGLLEARRQTDEALLALQQALRQAPPHPLAKTLLPHTQIFGAALHGARQNVDQLLGKPTGLRTPTAINGAVQDMVNVVPLMAPAVTLLVDGTLKGDPALAGTVNSARLSAELREYTGQLGSLFTAALVAQRPFTLVENAAIERVRGRIEQLEALLHPRLLAIEQDPRVSRAHEAMDQAVFTSGAQLVDRVIEQGRHNGQFDWTPADFAAQYVPTLNPILSLRDALLDLSDERILATRHHAEQSFLIMASLTLLRIVVIILILHLANRRIVEPLTKASHALQALNAGQLHTPLPEHPAEDEISEIMRGIGALKTQSQARVALEQERNQLIDSLRAQSATDFLTGLPNRRAFFEAAEAEIARARRHGFTLVLLLMDVDHFKRVNDTVGHAGGDQALVAVANTIRQTMRMGDLAARLGGEEFVALLSHCDPDDGMRFAERLREAVATHPVQVNGGHAPLSLTMSIGAADTRHHGIDLTTLLARADAAMYQAKHEGRNRTIMAEAA